MKVHEILKQLSSPRIQTGLLFDVYLPGSNKYTTNYNNHLEAISQDLLKRHGIQLIDAYTLDELPEGNCDRDAKTIAIANRESWRYCEYYYAQLFINLSHFRSKPPFIMRDHLIDSIVAYKILDYFMQNNMLTELWLANHFEDYGGDYYKNNFQKSAEGIVLYVDRQLNLILNHKSNCPLNYDYVDHKYFRELFEIGKPYLVEPDLEEPVAEWSDLDDFYENFHLL